MDKYLKYKKKYLKLVNTLKELEIYDQIGGLDLEELKKKKEELKKIYKDDPMWYDKNRPAPAIPPAPPLPKKTIPPAPPLPKKDDKVRYILKPYVYIPPYKKKIYYDFNDYEDSEDEYEYIRVKKSSRRKSTKRKSTKRKSTKRKSTKRKSTKRKSSRRKSTKRKSSRRKSTKRKSSRRKSTKRKSTKRKSSRRN